MYKQTQFAFGRTEQNCIIRTTDGACIPFSADNTDYIAYLAWLEAGNTPEAAE